MTDNDMPFRQRAVIEFLHEDLYLQFMGNRNCVRCSWNLFIDRIKWWYSTPSQVLTNAPALDSLIISDREDVADILEFLNHIQGNLRKLILECSWLGGDGDGLLANIVALYPDLEGLSLQRCHSLTSAGYHLIPHLKKLSELKLSHCQVHYLCVKLLETHVCIHECM